MMDYEDYLELGAIKTIEAPDEEIPWYDPYDEEQYLVDSYLNDEARLEAYIRELYIRHLVEALFEKYNFPLIKPPVYYDEVKL